MGNHVIDDHDTIADLVPAYALWAVTDEEKTRVEAHLLTCDTCRGELAALRGVARHLPLLVEEREPPVHLRQRLLTAVQAETEATTSPARPPERGRLLPWPRRLQPSVLAASVLLLLSLGLGAWNVALQGQLGDQQRRAAELQTLSVDQQRQIAILQARPAVTLYTVRGTADAPGATGQVVYLPQQNTAFLSIDNLPPLPAGRAYQVWYIQTGQSPIDAGLLATGPGQTATRLQVDLSRYQVIAVSQEPAGGSRQPTGPVVLQAPLTTGTV